MKVRLTVDEIIATIAHSALPTLVAEGEEDIIVLRRLEDVFSDQALSVMPVGGRNAVLEVFDRRREIEGQAAIGFIADRDTWIYSAIPNEYVSDILYFTDGYSIENDLCRDGRWARLLSAGEALAFTAELERFVLWYATALMRHLQGREGNIGMSPTLILDDPKLYERECALGEGEVFPQELYDALKQDPERLVRGKSLSSLFIRQLSHSRRAVKHSKRSLLEYGAVSGGTFMQALQQWLAARLG